MNKKCFYPCFIVLSFITTFMAVADESLTIYYTSSLNGNLDGCECKSLPKAGLVKTGYYLAQRDRDSSLLLEAGDFLDAREDELMADYILQSYQELEYTVIGTGDQEFTNGIEHLLAYAHTYSLLCNNLWIRSGESFVPFSDTPRIVTRNSLTIAVIAVIDPDVFYFYPATIKDNIFVKEPRGVLQTQLDELDMSAVDLVVVIYHGPLAHAEQIAQTVGGIDIMLVGHEQRLVDAERIGDTVIVSPGENGSRVGKLELSYRKSRKGTVLRKIENSFLTFEYKTDPDLASVRSRIDDYYVELTGRLK